MHTEEIIYSDGKTSFKGFVVYDDTQKQQRPGILVAHDWSGRNDFAMQKAQKLAELGYVGFAIDMFGDAKTVSATEEKMAMIQPLMENRAVLRQRVLAALDATKKISVIDQNKIAAIGFCFGGMCALELARSGANIAGVVSFHGLLHASELPGQLIKAKVLACHGYEDPMGKPDQVNLFAEEMTKAKADWQIHIYGHAKHAFTNPKANDQQLGLIYEAKADQRSWIAMKNFFGEIFG